MRWVKWTLVAGWVGVHFALWSEWPPSPRFILPADGSSSLVGFTDDSRSLVAGNGKGARVWDVARGELRSEWADPNPDPKRLTSYIGPNGRVIIAMRNPDRLATLDIDSGSWTELPPASAEMYGADADRLFGWHNAGLSANGQLFAYVAGVPETKTFVVRIWDVLNGTASEIALERRGFPSAFAPDGRTLAVWVDGEGEEPSYVLVVDAHTRREIGRPPTPPSRSRHLEFSPDGHILAAMGFGPAGPSWIVLWDTVARKPIGTIAGKWFAAWTADGRLLVRTGDRLNAFDGRTGAQIADWSALGLGERDYFWGTIRRGRIAVVESIHSMSPWGIGLNRLAARGVISYDNYFRESPKTVHLYDTRTGQQTSAISLQGRDGFCLSPDGQTLATLQFTGHIDRRANIFIWALPQRKPTGLVLALMIAEVAVAIAWTAWRRRRARRLRCAAH
jgi:WD40 repeat protein